MYVKDLSPQDRERLRTLTEQAGEQWENIQNLTVNELADWMHAREEDARARTARIERQLVLKQELADLAKPISDQFPALPLWKVEYFLHGDARSRFQAILRELAEVADVPLVTHDRQAWHGAVEAEISMQLRRRSCSVESIVGGVLDRDPEYPPARVRAYATYILETSAGMR